MFSKTHLPSSLQIQLMNQDRSSLTQHPVTCFCRIPMNVPKLWKARSSPNLSSRPLSPLLEQLLSVLSLWIHLNSSLDFCPGCFTNFFFCTRPFIQVKKEGRGLGREWSGGCDGADILPSVQAKTFKSLFWVMTYNTKKLFQLVWKIIQMPFKNSFFKKKQK